MPSVDLSRFHAVVGEHERALAELRGGRKRSHWMWYVFPQAAGLGQSSMSTRYAIGSLDEAFAYLADPVLGTQYRELVAEVWHQVVEVGVTVHQLFGSPDDAKLVSSLTLFAGIGRRVGDDVDPLVTRADAVLAAAAAQGLSECTVTRRFLEA